MNNFNIKEYFFKNSLVIQSKFGYLKQFYPSLFDYLNIKNILYIHVYSPMQWQLETIDFLNTLNVKNWIFLFDTNDNTSLNISFFKENDSSNNVYLFKLTKENISFFNEELKIKIQNYLLLK